MRSLTLSAADAQIPCYVFYVITAFVRTAEPCRNEGARTALVE